MWLIGQWVEGIGETNSFINRMGYWAKYFGEHLKRDKETLAFGFKKSVPLLMKTSNNTSSHQLSTFFFWLHWAFTAVHRLSLVSVQGGYSLIAVPSLLIVVASLVAKHRLYGTPASVVVVHGLSCPTAWEVFPERGSNLCPLHWQADSYPLSHQKSPERFLYAKHSPSQCICGTSIPCIRYSYLYL